MRSKHSPDAGRQIGPLARYEYDLCVLPNADDSRSRRRVMPFTAMKVAFVAGYVRERLRWIMWLDSWKQIGAGTR